MGKNEQFHQYGYDHYLKAPKKPKRPKGYGSSKAVLGRGLQSPALASVALLLAGVVFVGVVIATYPGSREEAKPIPIIQADLKPVKRAPKEAGGMPIRHAESTVLSRQEVVIPEGVENLLARTKKDEPVMKEDALEIAVSEVSADQPVEAKVVDGYLEAAELGVPEPPEIEAVKVEGAEEEKEGSIIEVVSSDAIDEQASENVLQKISSSRVDVDSAFEKRVAVAALSTKPRHKKMHAAGQSPETLDFVRSVLNDKNSKQAESVAKIEPAAGAASKKAVSAIAPGDFYVQLASIKDKSRAGAEWLKMKSKYRALSGADYRVQQASLSSGTFYRIQAGPMSKASADRVCASLKAAKKPGGCLVVKK